MKEVKRNFESYLNRRKVKNVGDWLAKMNILTPQQLTSFWEASGLEGDLDKYKPWLRGPTHRDPEKVTRVESKAKNADSSENEAWHVPAAKRPLTKSSKKRKSNTKSKRVTTVKKPGQGD